MMKNHTTKMEPTQLLNKVTRILSGEKSQYLTLVFGRRIITNKFSYLESKIKF